MTMGGFTDKQHPPSQGEIQASLGSQWDTWQELKLVVEGTNKSTGELKFYGKNYGWAVRYCKGGKALLSLYPAQAGFTVQIILSEDEIAQARQSDLTQDTLGIIDAAHPYSEGRWLFIPIKSNRDLQDIKRMLAIKTSMPRHRMVKNQSS